MNTVKQCGWIKAALVLVCIGLLCSCGGWGGQGGAAPRNPFTAQKPQPVTSSSAPSPSTPRPLFYDFPDIPIPNEMSLMSDDSYVFQSGAFKAGLLTFRGRVDLSSIINFFQVAMPRENWKPKGGFRYRRSVLIFEKPDKTCVINIYDKVFYSYVEIYVAPAEGQL